MTKEQAFCSQRERVPGIGPGEGVRTNILQEELARLNPIPRSISAPPNGDDDAHFFYARDSPKPFMNTSSHINPDVGLATQLDPEKYTLAYMEVRLNTYYTDKSHKVLAHSH